MSGEAENSGTLYRIDASRGKFDVQAFAEGILSFMGHNPTFAVRRYGGEIQFAAGDKKVDRCSSSPKPNQSNCAIM